MPHYPDQKLSNEAIELYFQMKEKRASGYINCTIKAVIYDRDTADPQSVIAELVKEVGYTPVALHEIEPREAQRILTYLLSRDLAYKTEVMSQEEAGDLAERFLSFFDSSIRYFTNAYFSENPFAMRSWTPLTNATFDTGVVVFSATRIGLLWAEDED